MVDLVTWSALVGVILPPVVALVNQSHWPSWAKGMVAVAASIVVGGVTAAVQGQLGGKTWTQAALVVCAATLAAYHLWWKPTGIAPKIEAATTVVHDG